MIDILRRLAQKLPHSPSPRMDIEILLAYILKVQRKDLLALNHHLTTKQKSLLNHFIKRRKNGEPIAYIIEKTEFYGFPFYVKKPVFIPRSETERLVEQALQHIQPYQCILDIGAGTGCIGLSLALTHPTVNVHAIEKDLDAMDVLSHNYKLNGSPSNYSFQLCDVKKHLCPNKKYDMVLSNPPYIRYTDTHLDPLVKKYESKTALFAGSTGFECLQDWSKIAYHVLKDNGMIGFEIGFQQAVQAKSLFKKNGFTDIHIIKDHAGLDRIIWAKKHKYSKE